MYLLLLGIIVLLLLYLFHKLYIKPLNYWEEKQIPYVKGLPLVGNFLKHFLRSKSFAETIVDIYNLRKNEKYYGIFLFNVPFFVVQDAEIIKSIMIKNFDHFVDHSDILFQGFDSLFTKNLVSLKGKAWHNMRITLSPAFTGSKMRNMFSLITECCNKFVTYFKQKLHGKEHLEFDFKDIYVRIAIDIMASAAFGLKTDSLSEQNNIFYQMVTEVSKMVSWKKALYTICPKLAMFLNIRPIPAQPLDYFRNLTKETIAYRRRENVVRSDMLNLLLEAQRGTLKSDEKTDLDERMKNIEFFKNSEKIDKLDKITDEDIAAQAFVFILGGVHTVANMLSFATYELAVNPDVQDRLYLEIKEVLDNNDGKITYETVQQLKYLDMVVSETLRMWPPATFLDRVCTKTYTLNVDDKEIIIERGTRIMVPSFSIQHDPEYFDDPYKFDPERFSDENAINIKPFTYMPFGVGPRNCIGSRLALMEAKLIICSLLKDFEVFVTSNTPIPPTLATNGVQLLLKNGYRLGLKVRNSTK